MISETNALQRFDFFRDQRELVESKLYMKD